MNRNIFLLLGTNIGNRSMNLEQARTHINTIAEVVTISSIFKSEAWGKIDQPEFYNQVVEVSSILKPQELLQKILLIEAELGRERNEKWGPRIIDIDILFYQNKIVQKENLNIPHPGIPFRKFTLIPLNEIASTFIHPVLNKNISTLLEECTDTLIVEGVVKV